MNAPLTVTGSGGAVAAIIDQLPVPKVPRLPDSDECFKDFVAEAQEGTTATVWELTKESIVLRQMARAIVRCVKELEPLHRSLGEARKVEFEPTRFRYATFKASELDEYAAVEGLLWDKLSPAAELLLKAELREELAASTEGV